MTADAFVTVDDKKLSSEEVRKMLSDAFYAGCELGFKEALEGAKEAVKVQDAESYIVNAIDEIYGPNGFVVMVEFEKWLKKKGGKT